MAGEQTSSWSTRHAQGLWFFGVLAYRQIVNGHLSNSVDDLLPRSRGLATSLTSERTALGGNCAGLDAQAALGGSQHAGAMGKLEDRPTTNHDHSLVLNQGAAFHHKALHAPWSRAHTSF